MSIYELFRGWINIVIYNLSIYELFSGRINMYQYVL